MEKPAPAPLGDRLQALALRGLIGGLLRLPYRLRVPLCGWVVSRLIAPVAGWRRRIRANLALIRPAMPPAEVQAITRAVPDNFGRTIIETWSGAEFAARAAAQPLTGPGLAALEAARDAGRPAIVITAHFGNYEAVRVALLARGCRLGGLYRPLDNRALNPAYEAALLRLGQPIFPRGKAGLTAMVRHLRSGGMIEMLIDQHMAHGTPMPFLGQPAKTALTAAEMALRHDAILVPAYGIRRADGLSFDVVVEDPIPPGTPEAMTQALNDSLGRLVDRHPGQWLWIHRRWK